MSAISQLEAKHRSQIIMLRAALQPFATAWKVATEVTQGSPKLTLAQIGAVAKHEIAGTYFEAAFKLLRDVPFDEGY